MCHDPAKEQTVFDLNNLGFNDVVSSWNCGKKISYEFCKDSDTSNCVGDNRESGAGTIVNKSMHHDNWVTSVILKNYNPFKLGAVTMFKDGDCKGLSASFFVDEKSTQKFWNKADM